MTDRSPKHRLSRLEEELAERDALIARQQEQIEALLGSSSWRLTAPYRFVGDCWHAIRRFLSTATALGRTAGGPARVVRLVSQAVRENGLGDGLAAAPAMFVEALHSDARFDYPTWIKRFDTLDSDDHRRMQDEAAGWSDPPLISVVMPVHNPPQKLLREALASVRGQIYPHWELCIADDASTDPRVRTMLEKAAASEPRIKTVFLASNRGIAGASNAALQLASGSWIALLDHDDLLSADALFLVAKAARAFPETRLFYSDEDKITEHGLRFNPYFKPDWNQTLLRSHNLVTHLAVYRADFLRELEGFRGGFDGAQDYDLALRCSEKARPEQIVHLPHVLYHWRSHAASTADPSSGAKPYAMLNGQKALEEHLRRTGRSGHVELLEHGYRVRYEIDQPPKASLIIPTRDRVELLSRCLESIRRLTDYPDYEILVVDNGSAEPAAVDYLRRAAALPGVRVLRVGGDFNFSRLNNRAVAECRGDLLALLNNDLEALQPDWLGEMAAQALQPGIGAVGALLLFPDDTVQHAGVVLGIRGVAGHSHKGQQRDARGYIGRLTLASEFSAVTAACLVVRKSTYLQAGGLDEENLPVAFNDVDFCLRLRELGYRNVFTPYAVFYHHESASRGYEDTPEKIRRFERESQYIIDRWGSLLTNDPAYNPNLTLDAEDFAFAWPPRIDRLALRPGESEA
jgi:GT2 family glycosyltransferase